MDMALQFASRQAVSRTRHNLSGASALRALPGNISICNRDKITPLFRQPDRVERLAQRGGKRRRTMTDLWAASPAAS
jgi:hypothetical protein